MDISPRHLLGFLVSPLLAPAVLGLYLGRQADLLVFSIAAGFAYTGMAIVGWPTFLQLRRRGLLSAPILTVSGMLGGALFSLWFAGVIWLFFGSRVPLHFPSIAIAGGAFGAGIALTFSLLVGMTWRLRDTEETR